MGPKKVANGEVNGPTGRVLRNEPLLLHPDEHYHFFFAVRFGILGKGGIMTHAGALGIVGAATLLVGNVLVHTQEGDRFAARLSLVPVSSETALTTSGSGSATAVLIERELVVTGTFDGLSSPATAAHLHRAPKGLRGPVAFELSITHAVTGVLSGSMTLTEEQVEALNAASYYVQVHSETNRAGEIRGWLLQEEF